MLGLAWLITSCVLKDHDRAGFGPISKSLKSWSPLPWHDVIRCFLGGINPPTPQTHLPTLAVGVLTIGVMSRPR